MKKIISIQNKDVITVIHLKEFFTVEKQYVDIRLEAPKAGTVIKISENLEPVLCKSKHINKDALKLIESCGIHVDHLTDYRNGAQWRTIVEGDYNGIKEVVDLYYNWDWESPPGYLSPNVIWIVSNDRNLAKIRYKIVENYLVVNGFHIDYHECIDRGNYREHNCHDDHRKS